MMRIGEEQVRRLRELRASAAFEREEHGYKWAVHLLVSRLLAEPLLGASEFPSLLADLTAGTLTAQQVGLSPKEARWAVVCPGPQPRSSTRCPFPITDANCCSSSRSRGLLSNSSRKVFAYASAGPGRHAAPRPRSRA